VSVTGSIDYGIHNDVKKQVSYGALKGDRNHLTFGVVEDLGGGTNVGVTLQMRFNSENGTAGYANTANDPRDGTGATQFEQVAIALNTAGAQVRVGRFTNAMGVADVHVFEDSKYGTNAARAAYGRLSNQIQITSPDVSGLKVALIAAQGSANKFASASGAGYIAGMDYSKIVFANANGSAGTQDFAAAVLNYTNGPLFVQYADINGLAYEKATKLSATYDFKVAKAYVSQYNQKHDIGIGAAAVALSTTAATSIPANNGLAAHKSTEYGVSVPFAGKYIARLAMQTNDKDLEIGKTDGSTKAKKTAMGLQYNLSKRTSVEYQRLSVTNGSSMIALGGTAGKNFGDITGSSYYVGMRHTF
jgi:hypothetical protein